MKTSKLLLTLSALLLFTVQGFTQHSVARKWNDVLLEAIRKDYARPTVHARNLFHVSMAMYDSWAAYDSFAKPYFMGNPENGSTCAFSNLPVATNLDSARNETMSYAAYRIIKKRFKNSPGHSISLKMADSLFVTLGYDTTFVTTDYSNNSYAALGNYIAKCILDFGLTDGANEQNDYANTFYSPKNKSLIPIKPGNPNLTFPNNWQPLSLKVFIDQGGNVIPQSTPAFLSPEWGNVTPFALTDTDLTIYKKKDALTNDSNTYKVYHDPGMPALLDSNETEDDYQWNFSLVSIWSSHLDPKDSVMIDISPASKGNITNYPTSHVGLKTFYNRLNGGDIGTGRTLNPKTNSPYQSQIVPRGDYARVLAEFWADGPDSETPPGHWFTLLNYVNDHPDFERKFNGSGNKMAALEWDVKAYLTLGGAMHDAAISAWGIKGYYDYIRPISAIRYMAGLGQSTDTTLNNYHKNGIPYEPGFIEYVKLGDSLAGKNNEHVGKTKLYTWKGPDYIANPDSDIAGVGWILAENWWPFQRPSFVTPPFAGYVSGHSTYSRAGAVIMSELTGDQYFPGGMGEFVAKKNEFLVFEEGPSRDITLQWATYQDASDECSLSRIWGGIHPPVDDMPGRHIGQEIGNAAFAKAISYFDPVINNVTTNTVINLKISPNPVESGNSILIPLPNSNESYTIQLLNGLGQIVQSKTTTHSFSDTIETINLPTGIYFIRLIGGNVVGNAKIIIQ